MAHAPWLCLKPVGGGLCNLYAIRTMRGVPLLVVLDALLHVVPKVYKVYRVEEVEEEKEKEN